MDKQKMDDTERKIIYLMCDSALWKTDGEWIAIEQLAARLLDSDTPIGRYSLAQLHACIAYTGSRMTMDSMRHDFWFCVYELARRKITP